MKIKLIDAINLIQLSSAVIIESEPSKPVVYATIADIEDDPENEFLYLGWEEEEGQGHRIIFIEENNQEVEIENSYMLLEDEDGGKVELKLLFPQNLEKILTSQIYLSLLSI